MNDKKAMEALLRLFANPEPLKIGAKADVWWVVMGAIQLACRHPEFTGPSRRIAEQWVRVVGPLLIGGDADLQALFDRGWDRTMPMTEGPMILPWFPKPSS
jgi:hypothetical protein